VRLLVEAAGGLLLSRPPVDSPQQEGPLGGRVVVLVPNEMQKVDELQKRWGVVPVIFTWLFDCVSSPPPLCSLQ
jgi:hypothetical protein